MKKTNALSRRDFLRGVGLGVLSVAGGKILSACSGVVSQSTEEYKNIPRTGQRADLVLRLRVVKEDAQILPGKSTEVWRYQGEIIQGDDQALQTIPGSYLGPVLLVQNGQRIRVDLVNEVNEPTIIHWHGMRVPPDMDGHPRDIIAPGQTYTYEFPILNRAGTYWFHPHPHTLTGSQVYRGLAGLILVSDDEERLLGLPGGAYDIPLVIQDRTFDADHRLVYLPNGLIDRMLGFLGDQILVNGKPDFSLPVERRAYRMRFLNGSNARVYKLAWEDGAPLTVIATDGGLLEKPVEHPYITLGPAERVDLWVDFSHWDPGTQLRLVSLAWAGSTSGMMGGMGGMMGRGGMGGMMGGGFSALPDGSAFPVMNVQIGEGGAVPGKLPGQLSSLERLSDANSVNANNPRIWSLRMRQMTWTINGRTFQMDEVARNEIVRQGTQETWIFDNTGSGFGMGMMGGMMQMAHPMHIHGVQFQVIDRQVKRGFESAWESVSAGFIDEGWKDSVLVMPGEQVKVAMRFNDYAGVYLNHCHNLEHEDQGMMRNYQIAPAR